MARFSVGGGDDNGEEGGSSSHIRKRPRTSSSATSRGVRIADPQQNHDRRRQSLSELDEQEESESRDNGSDDLREDEEEEEEEVEEADDRDLFPTYDDREVSGGGEARTETDVGNGGGEERETKSYRHRSVAGSYGRCSELRSCSNERGFNSRDRDGGVSVTLMDPEILDCCICYEPLTVPIFQCENGHIACSSCCTKLRNKCPSCLLPIGYNRCRAMEKVLESVRIPCPNAKYGCTERFRYDAKSSHAKKCIFTPCSCPIPGCGYIGSSKRLYKHFQSQHKYSGARFLYNNTISITFKRCGKYDVKYEILQEEEDGEIFVVDVYDEDLGAVVMVKCLAPPVAGMGEFSYTLTVKSTGSTFMFASKTKRIQELDGDHPFVDGHVVIPHYLQSSDGKLEMELNIQRTSVTPA